MKNDKCGIYKIYCKKNKQNYVGSSKQIYTRWDQHRYRLRKDTHTSPYLQNAWSKYGEGAFKFDILEECEADMLKEREQHWINELNPKFNSIRILHPRQKTSEEMCAKKSESMKKVIAANGGLPKNYSVFREAGKENYKVMLEAVHANKEAMAERGRRLAELGRGRKQTPESIAKRVEASRGKVGRYFRTAEWRAAKSLEMKKRHANVH